MNNPSQAKIFALSAKIDLLLLSSRSSTIVSEADLIQEVGLVLVSAACVFENRSLNAISRRRQPPPSNRSRSPRTVHVPTCRELFSAASPSSKRRYHRILAETRVSRPSLPMTRESCHRHYSPPSERHHHQRVS